MSKYDLGIFIFRKDLRLYDNLALIELCKKSKYVLPIFILDKNQITETSKNKYYRSDNAVQYMCESLNNLNKDLKSKLFLFFGEPGLIIEKIIKAVTKKFENVALSFNSDFTKYSIKRDDDIIKLCKKNKIEYLENTDDQLLVPFNKIIKHDNSAFISFGALYKHAIKTKPNRPIKNKYTNFISKLQLPDLTKIEYKISDLYKFYTVNPNIAQHGNRDNIIKSLINRKNIKDYKEKRDNLSYQTSNISAGLNFGLVSVREVYQLVNNIEYRRSLYWRSYYLSILRYVPNANDYTKYIDSRYDKIKWKPYLNGWRALMKSETGYLLIDACIKELQVTGFLHNRGRLLLSTFWIKYLLIDSNDKKYGSQVGFSKYLIDCCASQNKLNHEWIVDLDSSGFRYAPKESIRAGRVIRIDNDQIKKYDKDCIYIKKWLPHLKNVPNKDLQKWDSEIAKKYNNIHPSYIFDWEERFDQWIKLTKNI